MSFPPGTEMFQFPGFASRTLCIHVHDTCSRLTPLVIAHGRDQTDRWVSPFGNLRVKGCSHLTAAYRSVPRPSSPVYAKASTNCPYLTLENPHHHRQPCCIIKARFPMVWFVDPTRASGHPSKSCLDRTRSAPVRISQLDNHCVLADRIASTANHGIDF